MPAASKLTQDDDGLSQPWSGRVWLNPPYSNSGPWINKFIEHNNGVALVPFSKSAWFLRLWRSPATIVPLDPRFQFNKGGRPHRIFMPVFLGAFGEVCQRAIARCGTPRAKAA